MSKHIDDHGGLMDGDGCGVEARSRERESNTVQEASLLQASTHPNHFIHTHISYIHTAHSHAQREKSLERSQSGERELPESVRKAKRQQSHEGEGLWVAQLHTPTHLKNTHTPSSIE